jgi:chromosome segregation ATPase
MSALVSCVQEPQGPTPIDTPTSAQALNRDKMRDLSTALRDAEMREATLLAEIAKIKGELNAARAEVARNEMLLDAMVDTKNSALDALEEVKRFGCDAKVYEEDREDFLFTEGLLLKYIKKYPQDQMKFIDELEKSQIMPIK